MFERILKCHVSEMELFLSLKNEKNNLGKNKYPGGKFG